MPQIKKEDKANIKLKIIDILTTEPTISINKLSKRCGICRATARIYRAEMQKKIANIHREYPSRISIAYIHTNLDNLWDKIRINFQRCLPISFGMHFK